MIGNENGYNEAI